MINLLDFDQSAMSAFFAERGDKPFRAKQALRWIHHALADRVESMTDLARTTRDALMTDAEIRAPLVVRDSIAGDGTRKWLLDVGGANAVDAVYIPQTDRGTLCISSQAGCALDCSFCSTGKQGFNRNLSVAEIIGQLWIANRALLAGDIDAPWVQQGRHPITNVVMMGMGEPLANYDETLRAIRLLTHPDGLRLGARRITLSTSGLVPQMWRLADEGLQIGLAISLHAPNDELRSSLMPVNRRWPIAEVLDAASNYGRRTGRRVSFEYTLMAGVNDSDALAADLARLLRGRLCHVNLIPLNPTEDPNLHASSAERALAFESTLRQAGVAATIRVNRGRDILAACGQLRLAEKKRRERHAAPV